MATRTRHLIWLGWLLCSPVGAFAGAWTLPQGQLWTKVTLFQQEADEWYLASPEYAGGQVQPAGARRPYRFNGRYQSKAVFLEAFYGVTDRLDLGVQAPYLIQEYGDDTFLESSADAGLGDLRVFAKVRALSAPAVLTLKLGAKAPTGDFTNADGVIPVGEGQWDFDFIGQLGRSFWPLPLYANLDLGYRVRMKNEDIDRDPGDEWFFNAEVGVNLGRRLLHFTVLIGRAPGRIETRVEKLAEIADRHDTISVGRLCQGCDAAFTQRCRFSARHLANCLPAIDPPTRSQSGAVGRVIFARFTVTLNAFAHYHAFPHVSCPPLLEHRFRGRLDTADAALIGQIAGCPRRR